MMTRRRNLTLLDLLEIWISDKNRIILITLSLAIIFCVVHFLAKSNQGAPGISVIIAPIKSHELQYINEAQTLLEKYKDRLEGKVTSKNLASPGVLSRAITSNYITPTRLVYEYSDIVRKKLMNNVYAKSIRIRVTNHKFFTTHAEYLEFLFSFDNWDKEKVKEVEKIFYDSNEEMRKIHFTILAKLQEELLSIQNEIILKKITKIDEIVAMKKQTDSFFLDKKSLKEKEQRLELQNMNQLNLYKKLMSASKNGTSVIFEIEDSLSELQKFKLLLNDGKKTIQSQIQDPDSDVFLMTDQTPLYILNEKKRSLVEKLNKKNYDYKNIENLKKKISRKNFKFVEYISEGKNFINVKQINNSIFFLLYVIYFVLALIIAMAYSLILFLYKNKKRLA